jgi:hypothetical protein
MKNLFQEGVPAEIKVRISRLRPDSVRQWGKMNVAQALAHCAAAFEIASGADKPPRMLAGRLFGWVIKPLALGNDDPMRKNTPTVPSMVIADQRELDGERARLNQLIDRFVAAGPAGCTTHPHSFFGRLTPEEWSVLMYKHLDHHLRQFGV